MLRRDSSSLSRRTIYKIMCDKKSFNTIKEANIRISEINREDKSKHSKPIRAYKCEICGRIHITSMNKKQFDHNLVKIRERQALRRDEVSYWCRKLGVNNRGEEF